MRTQIILALIDTINELDEFKAEFIRHWPVKPKPKNRGLPNRSIFVKNTSTNTEYNIIVNMHAEILVFLLHTTVTPDGVLWYVGCGGEGRLVSTIPLSHPISIELMLKALRVRHFNSFSEFPVRMGDVCSGDAR